MATVIIKRGTRAQINAAAASNGLLAGEPYLITDEGRISVATAVNAHAAAAKQSDLIGRNTIINGGFTINQRGYVSAAALAAGAYGHDRWKAGAGGGDYTFTQLASNTTITISASKSLIQVIEDKNVHSTAYGLSWTGTATARYAVNSATPTGSYVASPIVITGQTVGTVMSIEFGPGTLGKVQLEAGSAATQFEPRHYQHELSLCHRYYYELGGTSAYDQVGYGAIASTTTAYVNFQHPVNMRAAPTLVSADHTLWAVHTGTATVAVSAGGLAVSISSPRHYNLAATTAGGLTTNQACWLSSSATTAARLTFSAEL